MLAVGEVAAAGSKVVMAAAGKEAVVACPHPYNTPLVGKEVAVAVGKEAVVAVGKGVVAVACPRQAPGWPGPVAGMAFKMTRDINTRDDTVL